ncbi:MAG: SRPBCC domain-containing protein [bacterium]
MKDIHQVPRDRLGKVIKTHSGDTLVQFVRVLAFSPEQVWQAMTDADALASWFPGFQLEKFSGGAFNIWFGDVCEGPAHVSGTVDVYDPPWHLHCGTMSWALVAVGGGCQLTFTDVVQFNQDHRDDFDITNSVLAGWHLYIDQLEDALTGSLDTHNSIEFDYSQVNVRGRASPYCR